MPALPARIGRPRGVDVLGAPIRASDRPTPVRGPTRWLTGLVALSGLAAVALVLTETAWAASPSASPRPPLCGEVGSLGLPGQRDDPDAVRELQLGLRLLALFPHPLDGRYDPYTREAVRLFQGRYGLPVTGVADASTLRVIARLFQEEAVSLIDSQHQSAIAAPQPEHLPLHPGARSGGPWVVVDTSRLVLTLYRDGQVQARWPVAVGKPLSMTPVGEWWIVDKGYAEGVFGTRWMGLDIPFGSYGIHGTDRPWSVGTQASAGCIRMYNADVERLFEMVTEGTPVTIVGTLPEVTWEAPLPAGTVDFPVPLLQWALRRHGFDPGRADARMGPVTLAAIREAQRVLGLPPVEAATPDLYRALGLRR